jgi:tetratricopeptide (TPR) repeat protein
MAVMPFRSLTDSEQSEQLAEIITHLLITDLSATGELEVVSAQRLSDLGRYLGREDSRGRERTVGIEVAREAGARWAVSGGILVEDSNWTVTYQMLEIETGNIMSSSRLVRDSAEDIFSLADRLGAELRLSLPMPIDLDHDPRVADVTTHSMEAYWRYLEGVDLLSKMYFADAASSFAKAVQYDSSFAMAYYHLADLGHVELIDKVLQYADQTTQQEQLLIRGLQARLDGDTAAYADILRELIERYPDDKENYFHLGLYHIRHRNYEEAITQYQRAIEIDPLYKDAYNNLGYLFNREGDYEKAIWAIEKYAELAPDEANPYDTRGDIYAEHGLLDEAIESYRRALEIKPDFYVTASKLANLYVFRGDYDSAEYWYRLQAPVRDGGERLGLERDLANILIQQGLLKQAIALLDSGLVTYEGRDSLDHWALHVLATRYQKSEVLARIDPVQAQIELKGMMAFCAEHVPEETFSGRALYAELLHRNGQADRADSVIARLEEQSKPDEPEMRYFHFASGWLALVRDNPSQAVISLEAATRDTRPRNDFDGHYLLARAFLAAGRTADAVETFEELSQTYTARRVGRCLWSCTIPYYLGIAYEQSRWPGRAVEQYETFLALWGEADVELFEVSDARERLGRLQQSP